MRRSLDFVITFVLLANFVTKTGVCSEAAERDTPVVISEPERWLDTGMAMPITAAVRPDGRYVVVTTGCETILYDLLTEGKLFTWPSRFSMAAYSADGSHLLTVQKNEVTVWQAENCMLVCRLKGRLIWGDPGFGMGVRAVISDDGSQVAVSNTRLSFDRSLPRAVLLYDTTSGSLQKALAIPETKAGRPVAFTSGGHRLLVRHDGPFPFDALLDTETGDLICKLPIGAKAVLSPDGRWLASGGVGTRRHKRELFEGDPTTLVIRDTATGKLVQTFKHEHSTRQFTFSPDSRRVLVACELEREQDRGKTLPGRLVEWDWQTHEQLFVEDSPRPYVDVRYSPNGELRFAVTKEFDELDTPVNRLCGWSVRSGDGLPIEDNGGRPFISPPFFLFPAGDRYIDLGWSFAVRDVLSGETLQTLPEYRRRVTDTESMPDGQRCLVDSSLVNLVSGQRQALNLGNGTGATAIDNGRVLFAHRKRHEYVMIDVGSGETVWSMEWGGTKYDAAVSADGKHVALALDPNGHFAPPSMPRLVLIEPSEPDRLRVFQRFVSALTFHPDGKRFLEAGPHTIVERNADSGVPTDLVHESPGRAMAVRYSPNGEIVLACGVVGHDDPRESVDEDNDGWAMLWNTRSGEVIHLDGHTGPVTTAEFSPGGEYCATGSWDTLLRVWEVETGKPICLMTGHAGGLNDLSWIATGRILAAAEDGAAIWNLSRAAIGTDAPQPLAASFSDPQRRSAKDTMGIASPLMGEFLPTRSSFESTSVPILRPQSWKIVQLDDDSRRRLSPDANRWLSHARAVESYDGPLPPPAASQYGRDYELCGVTPSGSRKAYVSLWERNVIVCDATGIIQTFDGAPRTPEVALSPSGQELAIAREIRSAKPGQRWEVRVCDANSGEVRRTIDYEGHCHLQRLSIGPREEQILFNWGGHGIEVRNIQTGDPIGRLERHPGYGSLRGAHSPDGRFIVTWSRLGPELRVYDRKTLAVRRTIQSPFRVLWIRFSPDGKRLLAGQENNVLTMWDLDRENRLWTRRGYAGEETIFSGDGSKFLTRTNQDISVLWDATMGDVLCVALGRALPVLSPDGNSLHLRTPDGPLVWSGE